MPTCLPVCMSASLLNICLIMNKIIQSNCQTEIRI